MRTGFKRIEREDEPRRVSLEVMLRGTGDRTRLLDLGENFTLFSEHKAGLVKIIGQNHQFLGVNNATARKVVQSFQKLKPHPPAEAEVQLSPREQEILELLTRGYLYKEMAEQLKISVTTVNAHIRNTSEKLHVHSRSQAVARYIGV